jgi:hypothetical protein
MRKFLSYAFGKESHAEIAKYLDLKSSTIIVETDDG